MRHRDTCAEPVRGRWSRKAEAQQCTEECTVDGQVESELAWKPHPHCGLWSTWICSEALLDPTAQQEAGPTAVEGTQHLSATVSMSWGQDPSLLSCISCMSLGPRFLSQHSDWGCPLKAKHQAWALVLLLEDQQRAQWKSPQGIGVPCMEAVFGYLQLQLQGSTCL